MTMKRMLLATVLTMGTIAVAPAAMAAGTGTSGTAHMSTSMSTSEKATALRAAGERTIDVPAATDQKTGMDENYVRSQLEKLGYTNVREVERSGDIFNALGDYAGHEMRLRVDGRSGAVTDQFDRSEVAIITKPGMDAQFVKEQLELQGFENVQQVSQSGDVFSARATHAGMPVELSVDAKSGDIDMADASR